MKLRFLGAAGTVTGSRYLLQQGNTKVLIDCGLFQGFKQLRLRNWESFPIPPSEIDAVVLTHSHLDHSGYLPLFVKNGFKGPIYATSPAIDLCKILLPDSGFLQEEEARFANKRNYSKHHPALPLYTVEDAEASLKFFKSVNWGERKILSDAENSISFELRHAGHLLGAASVLLKAAETSIIFSGDLGRNNDPMILDPESLPGADYLVVESTYGNRRHPERNPEEELKEIAQRTLSRKGILLIPSFAVGRAQLILYFLERLKKRGAIPRDLPVYLNSPMASKANDAFLDNAAELKISRNELQDVWKGVRIISSPEESMALNERTEPAIILAASGMATGGRVLHHLKTLAPDPKNT
ncbi:MAG: MBL fold metallo-hydrolase, partial [Bdellovibrionota bacterium]